MIEIDGSAGEGGGQILRSSLSLAICTQQPFRRANVRANRDKPGLLRQHLTAVKAAAEICAGDVLGADIGSRELTFKPGRLKGRQLFTCDRHRRQRKHLRSNAAIIETFASKRVVIDEANRAFVVSL